MEEAGLKSETGRGIGRLFRAAVNKENPGWMGKLHCPVSQKSLNILTHEPIENHLELKGGPGMIRRIPYVSLPSPVPILFLRPPPLFPSFLCPFEVSMRRRRMEKKRKGRRKRKEGDHPILPASFSWEGPGTEFTLQKPRWRQ